MYLGMVLALVGTALLLNEAWPWLVPCAFVAVLYLRFIRHEEVLMARTFGDAYLEYRQRVRRWI
jgi:protein-S-isoprenylcysteine O-methyltransferase Ste14